MKKINSPDFTIEDIYSLSLSFIDKKSIERNAVFIKLQSLTSEIYAYGANYEINAVNNNLQFLDSDKFSHVGKDLVGLYKNYFRNKKPNYAKIRKYYDLILTNGNSDRQKVISCPYCNSSFSEHIDHYLPESIYHGLSINPQNLVPSCYNCNKIKSSKIFKIDGDECTHFFHPYYDDLGDICWLKAYFRMQENMLTVSFDVDKNLDISKKTLAKITYTFQELKMAQYLSNKASETETINITSKFRSERHWKNYSHDEIVETLKSDYNLFYETYGSNHWQTAFYKELSVRTDLYDLLRIN